MTQKLLRHAYLIIAHNNFEILEKQVLLLDSPNADFYIHVDKKAGAFPAEALAALPQHSKIVFTDRTDVHWGGYSQIACELLLLKAALPGEYDYYHLLSGVDMPIKPRKQIEGFFQMHSGKEFLCFREKPSEHLNLYSRYMGHHFAHDSGLNAKTNEWVKFLDRSLCVLTPRKHYFPKEDYRFGSNWFSITQAFARYVVSQEDLIRRQFTQTMACDEIFLHTLCYNSTFRDHVYAGTEYSEFWHGCLRYIDFRRGRPYVFTAQDVEELLSAPAEALFARKFDYGTHPEAVEAVYAACR